MKYFSDIIKIDWSWKYSSFDNSQGNIVFNDTTKII